MGHLSTVLGRGGRVAALDRGQRRGGRLCGKVPAGDARTCRAPCPGPAGPARPDCRRQSCSMLSTLAPPGGSSTPGVTVRFRARGFRAVELAPRAGYDGRASKDRRPGGGSPSLRFPLSGRSQIRTADLHRPTPIRKIHVRKPPAPDAAGPTLTSERPSTAGSTAASSGTCAGSSDGCRSAPAEHGPPVPSSRTCSPIRDEYGTGWRGVPGRCSNDHDPARSVLTDPRRRPSPCSPACHRWSSPRAVGGGCSGSTCGPCRTRPTPGSGR